MATLYLHIPFCAKKCNYCDFYSTEVLSQKGDFVEALNSELKIRAEEFHSLNEPLTSIYIGGGTPSLLSIREIEMLLNTIEREYYPWRSHPLEVTIELNPDDVTLEYSSALRALGINRASLGIQSFNQSHLEWMNRRHSPTQAVEAYSYLRGGGFTNITIDLLFGYSPLDEELWEWELLKAIELAPQHISTYQLAVEEETALYNDLLKGRYQEPTDESASQQYTLAQQLLSDAGYTQYELSSFSLEGFQSHHNLRYWDFTPYLGLGPSAHSFDGKYRRWNLTGVGEYIDSLREGEVRYEKEFIDPKMALNERLIVSLRKVEGANYRELQKMAEAIDSESSLKLGEAVEQLLERELLVMEGSQIKIPPHHLFLSDLVVRELYLL